MAAKRIASTDLNHENWDQEEEPEEMGTFRKASADELKTRVIKTARRKAVTSSDEPTKSVFSGFAGFGKSTASASTVSSVSTSGTSFSFLSKISSTSADENKSAEENDKDKKKENFGFEKSNTYYAKLKGLNQAVSAWIKTHVDQNPLCILSPIFKDYDKYLKEIQTEAEKEGKLAPKPSNQFSFGMAAKADSSSSSSAVNDNKTPANKTSSQFSLGTSFGSPTKTGFSFGSETKPADSSLSTKSIIEPVKPATSFTFGATSSKSAVSPASSTFTFNSKPSEGPTSSTAGFSFTAKQPFTFGSSITKPETSTNDEGTKDDEDDEPPKVEFKPVVEEGSAFSKRCKVFVKHDGNFADRGIGTLYLKPVKDSEKTQLLVRADTNLGNILLNFILSDGLPTQRMGKNNVMIVCIPTPEGEQKPTSILLRVKTAEEADELLEKINKYKK